MNIYGVGVKADVVSVAKIRVPPDGVRLAVTGRLAPATVQPVREAITAAIRQTAVRIEIDLTDTVVADADDLICLVDLCWTAERGRAVLTFVNLPDRVRELLSETLLPQLLSLHTRG